MEKNSEQLLNLAPMGHSGHPGILGYSDHGNGGGILRSTDTNCPSMYCHDPNCSPWDGNSCGTTLYDFSNPNHHNFPPSQQQAMTERLDERLQNNYHHENGIQMQCVENHSHHHDSSPSHDHVDKDVRGRGKAKTVYETNAKRRTKFAKLRVNRIKDDILGFEAVTGGKAYAAISYMDGRGKKIKEEFGSKTYFVKLTQPQILQNPDPIVDVVVGAFQSKLGAVLTALNPTSPLEASNINTSPNDDSKQSISLLIAQGSPKSFAGNCLVCGNKELMIDRQLYDGISLVCSYGHGMVTCQRSAHLYCLGLLTDAESTVKTMPPYYCLDHRKEGLKILDVSPITPL